MRKLWKLVMNLDEQLSEDLCKEVKEIVKDAEIRQALNEKNSKGLHLFCDNSAEAYGFVTFAVDQDNRRLFIFPKSN